MLRRLATCFALAVSAASLLAQNQPAKPAAPTPAPAAGAKDAAAPANEAELGKQAASLLVAFARVAESNKMPARAREAYEMVVAQYDADNATARAGLGWKRAKKEWQQATPSDKLPANSNNLDQKKVVTDAWTVAKKRVAALHRDLGLALQTAGEAERARQQLERAISFAPEDAVAHRALGHEQLDDFFGTATEIAFVRRYRAIVARARAIGQSDVKVEPVPDSALPSELRATGYSFAGARSAHVTFWVLGGADDAARCATWYERAGSMLEFLLAESPEGRKGLDKQPVRWIAVLRTAEQRQHLLEVSPATRNKDRLERALLYGGAAFESNSGRAAWCYQDLEVDGDNAVAQLTKRGTPEFNQGFSEGLVHAMTWLLVGTCETWFMNLPLTASGKMELTHDPVEWLESLREQVDAHRDWPLVQVPRERMDNFRNAVRTKSWSFVLWLLARHPQQWDTLLTRLGHDALEPEEVERIFAEVLGRPIGEVEDEWRNWVRRGSAIGRACGLD
jgi:tetratricopeptide (TPR) repeat protein